MFYPFFPVLLFYRVQEKVVFAVNSGPEWVLPIPLFRKSLLQKRNRFNCIHSSSLKLEIPDII